MTITEQEIALALYCKKHYKDFCEMDLEIINDEYNNVWEAEHDKA